MEAVALGSWFVACIALGLMAPSVGWLVLGFAVLTYLFAVGSAVFHP